MDGAEHCWVGQSGIAAVPSARGRHLGDTCLVENCPPLWITCRRIPDSLAPDAKSVGGDEADGSTARASIATQAAQRPRALRSLASRGGPSYRPCQSAHRSACPLESRFKGQALCPRVDETLAVDAMTVAEAKAALSLAREPCEPRDRLGRVSHHLPGRAPR
jgi:hypothetical protein